MNQAGLNNFRLYLIEILHQTTTESHSSFATSCCILSKFYIKPQQNTPSEARQCGCILSKFYIKPQLFVQWFLCHSCCILSKFYIKPQLVSSIIAALSVVSYRNSTSNHNYGEGIYFHVKLYLIEILHQTTTAGSAGRTRKRLYLIEILHQTTTTIALPLRTAELYLIEILHQTTTTAVVTTSDS